MVQFINTENTTRIITLPINYDLWSAVNTNVSIAPTGALHTGLRILDAVLEKEIAFDTGTVKLGVGTTSADRETFATGAEVACTTVETKTLETWKSGTLGGYNKLLATANRTIYARYEGSSLPTQGRMFLHITVLDLSPRTAL